MKRLDIMRRAGRNLGQAKIRTLLTALAISVGAFTITLALAAGTGGKLYTDSLIQNNGDTLSLSVFPEVDRDSGPQEYGTDTASTEFFVQKDIDRIEKVSGVSGVTPIYSVGAEYVVGPSGKQYTATLSIKSDRTNVPLLAGELKDSQPDAGKVIISESYVSALGFTSAADAIGKQLTVHIVQPGTEGQDMNYVIQAVSEKSNTILNYQDGIRLSPIDGKELFELQKLPGTPDRYFGALAQVKEGEDPALVKEAIQKLGYSVFSVQDLQQVLFTFVNVVMGGAAGFGALAILASIFGIINTQYISVLERTQQIGLMKALGARRKDIARLFRYEAAWVGFLGGLIGTVGAIAMGAFNPLIAKQLDLEEGTQLLVFESSTSIILILGLVLVAVIAGWLPARKAAKLDPIEALRTE